MIVAAFPWLAVSINLVLVIFMIICVLMTLVILMQRPKQEGLGAAFGAGVTDQVFGARTTNVLQRGTVYLGSAFFILSFVLAILIGQQNKTKSLLEPVSTKKEEVKVTTPPPAPKSLADELPPAPAPVETLPPVETAPDAPSTQAPAPEAPAPAPEAPATPAPEGAPSSETSPPVVVPPADGAAPAPEKPPGE